MSTQPSAYKTAFDNRTDLSEYGSNALLLFALQMRYQIEDIHTVAEVALTDGPDDKKCDLVYIDEESGEVVIAQGWVAQNERAESAKANKASDLNTAVSWLIGSPLETIPERLRSGAEELRFLLSQGAVRTVRIWFVHNVAESDNVQREMSQAAITASSLIRTHYPDHDAPECTALEVGRRRLDEWYKALTVPILVSDELSVTVDGAFELDGDDWSAIVTAVPAFWLYSLFQKHGTDLFSANVRSYLGSRRSASNINHGIKQTAAGAPGRFWAYNNGVTALCHKATADFVDETREATVTISGISIVNGAQTTGAIGQLGEPPPADMLVPARFVVCRTPETVKNIIRYNNSQNPILPADFRSNDRTQSRLIKEFASIPECSYAGGRRGGQDDAIRRPSNAVPAGTAAQALAAILGDPGVAFHQKSEIWESDKLYSKYFSETVTARHVLFALTLYQRVVEQKRELQQKEKQGAARDKERLTLDFLRHRGAPLLFVSAVGASLETILGRPIPSIQRLTFKANVSPSKGRSLWAPVVSSLLSLHGTLHDALTAGLRRSSEVGACIDKFVASVEAVREPLDTVFSAFSENVTN